MKQYSSLILSILSSIAWLNFLLPILFYHVTTDRMIFSGITAIAFLIIEKFEKIKSRLDNKQ